MNNFDFLVRGEGKFKTGGSGVEQKQRLEEYVLSCTRTSLTSLQFLYPVVPTDHGWLASPCRGLLSHCAKALGFCDCTGEFRLSQ